MILSIQGIIIINNCKKQKSYAKKKNKKIANIKFKDNYYYVWLDTTLLKKKEKIFLFPNDNNKLLSIKINSGLFLRNYVTIYY